MAGAAIATIAAQAVSVILLFITVTKKELPFHISKEELRLGSEVKRFFGISAPSALQELLTNVSFLALIIGVPIGCLACAFSSCFTSIGITFPPF